MISIITNKQVYKVKISQKDNGSNYNTWAHIFKPKEKMPIAGTMFRDNIQAKEVIEWAKGTIEMYNNQTLINL